MKLNTPFTVAPREGKYYGTKVLDANGDEVCDFWSHYKGAKPSRREKEYFGGDWTEEAWADYCCDSHWECESDLALAEMLVIAANGFDAPTSEEKSK